MEYSSSTEAGQREGRPVYRSWKAIAGHFGVSVRTVQHWELDRGLPIHRMPGERGRVYAYADELDAWRISAGPEIEPPGKPEGSSRFRVWAAAAALSMTAVAATYIWVHTRPRPESWAVEGRDLIALGRDGETLWRHAFPKPLWRRWLAPPEGVLEYRTMPVVEDLDGDGANEVVAVYWPKDEQDGIPEVHAFDSDGSPEWNYRVRTAETASGRMTGGPFDIRMLFTVPRQAGRPPALIAVSNQRGSYASQVAVLSPRGKVLREYWHSGHILHAEVTAAGGCGVVMYLAAQHAATGASEIIVLDPQKLSGASSESDPAYQLAPRSKGSVVARIRLSASELARQLGTASVPIDIRIRGGRVHVSVSQSGPPAGAERTAIIYYSVDLSLRDPRVDYARTFPALKERLVNQGRVKRYDTEADARRVEAVQVVVPWREESCAGAGHAAAGD
ncbi:MAG: hypothetical protein C0504_08345 [Candidatus Solibacter sp.]|nr:hypothetical protein [Candidatus Solibacter sp.]